MSVLHADMRPLFCQKPSDPEPQAVARGCLAVPSLWAPLEPKALDIELHHGGNSLSRASMMRRFAQSIRYQKPPKRVHKGTERKQEECIALRHPRWLKPCSRLGSECLFLFTPRPCASPSALPLQARNMSWRTLSLQRRDTRGAKVSWEVMQNYLVMEFGEFFAHWLRDEVASSPEELAHLQQIVSCLSHKMPARLR